VKPATKATAALYTYTPWVGAYAIQCGRDTVGGSSLVALVFNRYKGEYAWGDGKTCYSGTVDANVSEYACVQSSSDALWRQCVAGVFGAGTTTKPTNCSTSYPYCSSATLGRSVPTRTCVQSRSDSSWNQCGVGGAWLAAPNVPTTGSGPAGTCYQVYAL
jgi:hypothetical protein